MDTNPESEALIASSTKNRRKFLASGIATMISAGLLLGGEATLLAQEAKQKKADEQLQSLKSEILLTRSKFFEHRSEVFTIRLNGEEYYLQLVEVEALKNPSVGKSALQKVEDESFKAKLQEESFTLVFRTTNDLPRRQGTFELEHHTMGEFEIFLTQIGKTVGPWRFYEAVFNRLQE